MKRVCEKCNTVYQVTEHKQRQTALTPNERNELENLRAECERLRSQQPETRLEEKINCYGCGLALPKSALETGYNPIVDDVRVAVCQRCWDAGVGLQEKTAPETRAVKVRFDVTAEDLAAKIHHALHGGWPELSQEGDRTKAVWIDTAQIAMDYLADHAVIDCAAYEARIAELEAERDEARDDERVTSELFQAACNDLGDAQGKLTRIAALVKPVPVAELVVAGNNSPALLAERHRQIRAILEDEG